MSENRWALIGSIFFMLPLLIGVWGVVYGDAFVVDQSWQFITQLISFTYMTAFYLPLFSYVALKAVRSPALATSEKVKKIMIFFTCCICLATLLGIIFTSGLGAGLGKLNTKQYGNPCFTEKVLQKYHPRGRTACVRGLRIKSDEKIIRWCITEAQYNTLPDEFNAVIHATKSRYGYIIEDYSMAAEINETNLSPCAGIRE